MTHCSRRSTRRVPAAGQPIHDPLTAIDLVMSAAGEPQRPETIVICLDASHRGDTVVVIDHPDHEPVEEIAEIFLRVGPSDRFGALVLATVRPGPRLVTSADRSRWRELRAAAERTGLQLLDWFLVSSGDVTSMAEITDSPPLWQCIG
jgi:DNA repair protein RadC